MCKNIGKTDKTIRLVIGFALISLVFFGPQTPWGWVGSILILTALLSFCPLYKIIGIQTCQKKNPEEYRPRNKEEE